MPIHDLKIWPTQYAMILQGKKTFELRRDDRPYAIGDQLLLREYDPGREGSALIAVRGYTGRGLIVKVPYLIRGPLVFGPGPLLLPEGVVCMSIDADCEQCHGARSIGAGFHPCPNCVVSA